MGFAEYARHNRQGTVEVRQPVTTGPLPRTERVRMPVRDITARIARLQADPRTRKQGLAFQAQYQHFIPEEELKRVGLEKIKAPKPGRLKGLVGGVVDVITRPSQTILQGIEGARERGIGGLAAGAWGGLSGRGERATIFDAFGSGREGKRRFAGIREGSGVGKVAEIVGEAALDPLTYLTFGGGQVARRGTETAARTLGSEAAEQVARRGVSILDDAQRATLRREMGDKFFDTFAKRARGGVMLGRNRTLIPGEAVRRPLRAARLIDDQRRAAAGITKEGIDNLGRHTLQSRIRSSEGYDRIRSKFAERADLRAAKGGSVGTEATTAEIEAAALSGQLNEMAVQRIESALKPVNRALRKSGASADEVLAVRRSVLNAIDNPRIGEEAVWDATLANLRSSVPDSAMKELEEFANTLRFEMGVTTQTAANLGDPTTLRRAHAPAAGPDAATVTARANVQQTLGDAPLQGPPDGPLGPRPSELNQPLGKWQPSQKYFSPEPRPPGAAAGGSHIQGQIPGQESLTGLGLPRVPTREARQLADDLGIKLENAIPDAQLGDISVGGKDFASVHRGNISAVNERLTEFLNERAVAAGRKPITNALETDPARLVGVNTVQVNRGVAASQLADDFARIRIPDTNDPLILKAGDVATDAEAARLGYERVPLGYDEVWVPPELTASVARFHKVALSNPTDFGNFYDKYLNLWKSMATVPVPFSVGFHSRNLTGNIFNNWIAGGIQIRHYAQAKHLQKKIGEAQRELASRIAKGELDPSVLRAASLTDDVPTPSATGRFRDPLGPPEFPSMPKNLRWSGQDIQNMTSDELLNRLDELKRLSYRKPPAQKGGAELSRRRKELDLPESEAIPRTTKAPDYPRIGDNLSPAELDELSVLEEEVSRRVQAGFPKPGRRKPISGIDPETGERLRNYIPVGRKPNVEVRDLSGFRRRTPPMRSMADMPEFEDALRAVGATDEEIDLIMQMKARGVITSGYFRNDLHENALQELSPEEVSGFIEALSDPRKMKQYLAESLDNPQRMWIVKKGADLGHGIESNARMAHYLGKIDEGFSPANAMLSVKKHLFDYSDLTVFERNVMRRIIPFYTFMRFNTPLQFQMFITQPRKLLAANRLQQAIAAIGGDPGEDFSDKALSSWAVGSGDQPLSKMVSNWITQGRDEPVVMGLDLPSIAAIEAIEPWVLGVAATVPGMNRILPEGEDPKDGFLGLVSLAGGGPAELVKFVIEEGTNKDLFTGAPVEGRDRLQALFDSQMPLKGKAQSVFKRLVRPSGDPEGDDAKLSIFNLMTGAVIVSSGMNFYQITPQRQRGEMYGVLDRLDREIRAAKRAGVDVPTLTELREAGLVPTLKQLNAQQPQS